MDLIQEFHSDHRQVVNALVELRHSIETNDVPRIRTILESAEHFVGPHFKFEELHLYPVLERLLGESHAKKLVNEHDGIFRSIRRIAQLAQKSPWSGTDHEFAMTNLELIYEHPISCDGLSLWMERLSAEEQSHLLEKMLEVRRQGTTLSEYYRERQSA